mmetsp:Transcript_38605/g.97685  ORF Transcript_38605/g.97685 Transcript_38605/m.97685 type:complete len:201 (+) Transcript_38605:114-716(+)
MSLLEVALGAPLGGVLEVYHRLQQPVPDARDAALVIQRRRDGLLLLAQRGGVRLLLRLALLDHLCGLRTADPQSHAGVLHHPHLALGPRGRRPKPLCPRRRFLLLQCPQSLPQPIALSVAVDELGLDVQQSLAAGLHRHQLLPQLLQRRHSEWCQDRRRCTRLSTPLPKSLCAGTGGAHRCPVWGRVEEDVEGCDGQMRG